MTKLILKSWTYRCIWCKYLCKV